MAEKKEPLSEKVALVALGALLSMLGVVTNSLLQTHAQRQQLLFDRKLAAFADYTNACSRRLEYLRRMVEMLEDFSTAVETTTFPANLEHTTDRYEREYDSLVRDGQIVFSDSFAKTQVVNALFGLKIDVKMPEYGERLLVANLSKEENALRRKAYRDQLASEAKYCSDTASDLGSRLVR